MGGWWGRWRGEGGGDGGGGGREKKSSERMSERGWMGGRGRSINKPSRFFFSYCIICGINKWRAYVYLLDKKYF